MGVNGKHFKKVPPEGGWGFLVLIGLAIFLTFTLGTFPSLALIFGEFLSDLGEETSALTMLMSCYFASFSLIGLVTNYFFKLFSVRAVALSGAMVFMLGSVSSIFARSLTELILAFGLLEAIKKKVAEDDDHNKNFISYTGAGFGLMISASYTTFNAYFVKKHIMMMSVAQSLFGLGTMAYPIFVQYFMEEYGYRGFMAIRASIHGHVIFGMLVMHPVDWHMRKVVQEDELLVDDQVYVPLNDIKNQQVVPINDENTKTTQVDLPCRKSVENNSLKTLWKKVVDFLDLTLLKDIIYVNISLGISFALYSDMSFFAIQPLYLLELNFSKLSIAHVIAIGATADLFSRIFLAISSTWIRLKARDIYLIGAALTILTRFAFLYVKDFLGMSIITAIMGFLRTWIHVPLPLVFGDYLPAERFPSGYGLFMFIQRLIMFVFGPIVLKIRDVTQDYILTFHCLTVTMAFCVVPWMIEKIWIKLRKN